MLARLAAEGPKLGLAKEKGDLPKAGCGCDAGALATDCGAGFGFASSALDAGSEKADPKADGLAFGASGFDA